uniref:DNA primase n=1 Tax=Herbidospora sakaeratensis TaxID=564415 RepID=UPI0007804398|nr:DNA primase [Herbidospora sakaeratensis]
MAGRISDDDIALVRERSPIADVIGEYVQLRNAGGGNLKGLCPFHDEKSPSFNVTPARGMYYCFGCSEGGDVISFLQRIDALTFAESVERLAGRAGIQLRYEQGGYVPGRQQGERSRLIEAHRAAAEFYVSNLTSPEAAVARRFLSERGFERADADHFGVGYAPNEWEALSRHLMGRGFSVQELIKGGLAREGRRGPIDRFRGRLIWPIRDITGDVIGFGARKLIEADDGPKYLNTPESPIYHKSSVLYGIDLAKREISKRSQAVVVEGYTDVMALHLAGVPTAVATCGTAFGEDHIKVLRRILFDHENGRGEVIFTFDGDSAGQKASLRAFQGDQRIGTNTFVAVQPDGLDPCDLRLRKGDAAVRDLVASREPLFSYAIRNVIAEFDVTTNEGRVSALDAAAPVVASLKDDALRIMYAKDLDRWLGIMNEPLVQERVRQIAARLDQSRKRPKGDPPVASESIDPLARLEVEALKLAIQRPALLGPEFDTLGAEAFTRPEHAALFTLIASCGGTAAGGPGGREWVEILLAAVSDDLRQLLTRLAVDPVKVETSSEERYGTAVLAKLQEVTVGRQLDALKARMQRLNPIDEQGDYNRMFAELVALEQQRRVLRERAAGA